MNMILFATACVTVIGLICAVALCAAAKFMGVPVDERVEQIIEALPGSNCGACGYVGCADYAEALASGNDVPPNLCIPGGADAAKQIGDILGVDAGAVAKKLAVVHCRTDCEALQTNMDYDGIKTCAAAKQLFNGEGACAFGCLGFGDCQFVCPSDAVCMDTGFAQIRTELCTGCGLCMKACPKRLITVEDTSATTIVLCKNIEKGALARKHCAYACIGCLKCARECPAKAITVEDNLASIDYDKCEHCGHCAEICPTKCIQLAVNIAAAV